MKHAEKKKLKAMNKASVTQENQYNIQVIQVPFREVQEGTEKNAKNKFKLMNYKPTDSRRARKLKQDKHKENHTETHHNQVAENL